MAAFWKKEGNLVTISVAKSFASLFALGVFASVNYEDGEEQKARAFITSLALAEVRFLEVPFNVLKRRQMGLADFDPVV